MEVPEDTMSITFEDGQEEAERQIKLLCTRLLPGWSSVSLEDMQVSRISGGISNLLVKLQPPPPLQPVAVKVFGDKTELLIDREAEKRALLRLNVEGFGAPVVGLFGNGRIEAFLEAKTLTPEEMADPRFVSHIARRLRAFHDLNLGDIAAAAGTTLPATTATVTLPASTSTSASETLAPEPETGSGSPASPQSGSFSSSQWDTIFAWLAMAESLSFPHDPAKQAVYDKVDFGSMRREIEGLRGVCERVRSPRVFCHNDLLSGNILIVQPPSPPPQQQQAAEAEAERSAEGAGCCSSSNSGAQSQQQQQQDGEADAEVLQGGTLQFIDFEYSCYGHRGFDLGNHFNEYAGFDCVYSRFPTPEQQKTFFRQYLLPGELRRLAQQHLARSAAADTAAAAAAAAAEDEGVQVQGEGSAVAAAEEAALDRLVSEACVYALASHAYWGVWSFIQARYSPIEFDYLDYSALRWAEYHRRKEEFMAMVDRHFPQ